VVVTHDRAIPEVRRAIAIPARGPTETVAMIDLVLSLPLPAGGVEVVLLTVEVEVEVVVEAEAEAWAVADGAATEDPRCLYHPEVDLTALVVDRHHPPVVEDGALHHPIVPTKV